MSDMNEDNVEQLAEVRARNKELQRCLRKEYQRAERLLDERNRLREACHIYRDASLQNHDRRWDMKMTRGVNCPECIRANVLRNTADTILQQTETEVSDE